MAELIRFSEINLDRLNKAMLQLKLQMDALQREIDAIKAAQRQANAAKPGYPGIENGSVAMIQGPVPGGPSPLEPWLTPHSMLIGEGSTPVKQIVGTDGQIPIACTGGDPAFANLTGDGVPTINLGIGIKNSCNGIIVSLNDSVQSWIRGMQAWAQGMQTWAGIVSGILGISPPSPTPPASGPT